MPPPPNKALGREPGALRSDLTGGCGGGVVSTVYTVRVCVCACVCVHVCIFESPTEIHQHVTAGPFRMKASNTVKYITPLIHLQTLRSYRQDCVFKRRFPFRKKRISREIILWNSH